MNYERTAVELVRALRGQRSRAALSQRLGYRSNVVHRWETQHSWPTASAFLRAQRILRPQAPSWIERFFNSLPAWAAPLEPTSSAAVAAFLRQLRGKTPVLRVAALAERNRYSIVRWLAGSAEPKLPDFLRLVDVMSRRLPDLIAALEDPVRVPSIRKRWQQLELARRAGYELPWSHAVLRALELRGMPQSVGLQRSWLAQRLRITEQQVSEALAVLELTEQVKRSARGYRLRDVMAIDTGRDPERARALRVAWLETALERLKANTPGRFGYSVFAVSRADLQRLHGLHLQYVRAMQEVIARSGPSECVGLYCSQLLDLGAAAIDAPAPGARWFGAAPETRLG